MANGSSIFTFEGLGIALPHSTQAEQSVLGAALLDPDSINILIEKLRPEMFYVRQNRAVYTEMLALVNASAPVDVVVLADRLSSDAAFPNPGDAKGYLAELAATVPSLTNLPHYIGIVYEKYIKRQLMEQARDILEQADEDIESKVLLESTEQRLYEISHGRETSEVQSLRDAIIAVMGHLQRLEGPDRADYLGIQTGYSYLDSKLTGMGKSDLIILAARPGMGKTSFALNITMNVAKNDIPVMFFSLEMTKDQLAGRILSAEAQLSSHKFRTGMESMDDWNALTQMSEVVGKRPIYMDDSSAITVAEMKSKVRRVNSLLRSQGKRDVGLLVVDYLQLMSTGRRNDNRVQEISEITRGMKNMAKELGLPVMLLSQLSRGPEKGRADHRPMLSDLRDSGSIEQDADVVLFLYRDAYYDNGPDSDLTSAQCIIAKNRHGETATVEMHWDGEHTRFVERDFSRE